MINNIELIKPLLNFTSEDDFYFIQICLRKKDHPNLALSNKHSAHIIREYYLTSLSHLDKIEQEMLTLCEVFKARAYINLNKRSFKKTSLKALTLLAENISNENYKSNRSVFQSATGKLGSNGEKYWVLDYDFKPTNIDWDIDLKGELHAYQPMMVNKVKAILPTLNGLHVICTPFDSRKFVINYPDVEIKKNNPTILINF